MIQSNDPRKEYILKNALIKYFAILKFIFWHILTLISNLIIILYTLL